MTACHTRQHRSDPAPPDPAGSSHICDPPEESFGNLQIFLMPSAQSDLRIRSVSAGRGGAAAFRGRRTDRACAESAADTVVTRATAVAAGREVGAAEYGVARDLRR